MPGSLYQTPSSFLLLSCHSSALKYLSFSFVSCIVDFDVNASKRSLRPSSLLLCYVILRYSLSWKVLNAVLVYLSLLLPVLKDFPLSVQMLKVLSVAFDHCLSPQLIPTCWIHSCHRTMKGKHTPLRIISQPNESHQLQGRHVRTSRENKHTGLKLGYRNYRSGWWRSLLHSPILFPLLPVSRTERTSAVLDTHQLSWTAGTSDPNGKCWQRKWQSGQL